MALVVSHRGQEAFFGNEPHLVVGQKRSFGETIFWLLAERQPSPAELIVFDLILNLSIDHGPDTPSAKAVITAAKSGESIGGAVAAGVREINDVHGGAQELFMSLLYRVVQDRVEAKIIVQEHLEKKLRVPGFGHRLYEHVDPRAELILQTLKENNLGKDYIVAARQLNEELFKQTGKNLPLNIDGAIAVALCAFSWSPSLGKAVFIIARTPGLCGQFLNSF